MLAVPASGASEAPRSGVVKKKFPKEKERSQRRSLGIYPGTELLRLLECRRYTWPMATKALHGDISDLARGRAIRLEADRKAPMSERLARVHALCKQLSAIKGAARAH